MSDDDTVTEAGDDEHEHEHENNDNDNDNDNDQETLSLGLGGATTFTFDTEQEHEHGNNDHDHDPGSAAPKDDTHPQPSSSTVTIINPPPQASDNSDNNDNTTVPAMQTDTNKNTNTNTDKNTDTDTGMPRSTSDSSLALLNVVVIEDEKDVGMELMMKPMLMEDDDHDHDRDHNNDNVDADNKGVDGAEDGTVGARVEENNINTNISTNNDSSGSNNDILPVDSLDLDIGMGMGMTMDIDMELPVVAEVGVVGDMGVGVDYSNLKNANAIIHVGDSGIHATVIKDKDETEDLQDVFPGMKIKKGKSNGDGDGDGNGNGDDNSKNNNSSGSGSGNGRKKTKRKKRKMPSISFKFGKGTTNSNSRNSNIVGESTGDPKLDEIAGSASGVRTINGNGNRKTTVRKIVTPLTLPQSSNTYEMAMAPYHTRISMGYHKDRNLVHASLQDSEDFFAEPHEDQDPINIELIRQKEDKRRQNDLSELAQQKKSSQTQILQQLQIKWNFQLQEFHLRIEKLQEKMEARQRTQRDDLESQHHANIKALEEKGAEEMTFLKDKNQKDLHDIHQKYSQWINPHHQQQQQHNNNNQQQQQQQPNELPPQMQQMRAVDIHQNTQKAMELRHNLNQKVNELLLESDTEYKKKLYKLQNHHQKRKVELDSAIKSLSSKLQQRHDQVKFQRMREHESRYVRMQVEIQNRELRFGGGGGSGDKSSNSGGSRNDDRKDANTDMAKGGPSSNKTPLMTNENGTKKGMSEDSCSMGIASGTGPGAASASIHTNTSKENEYQIGAALRQKRRKAFLSRSLLPTFLIVEIHNEGLNVSCRIGIFGNGDADAGAAAGGTSASTVNSNGGNAGSSGSVEKVLSDFLPWGYIARRFLHSITCGEIPDHPIFDKKLLSKNNGQIKCLISSRLVSNEEAIQQRDAAREGGHVLQELSKRSSEHKATLSNDIQAETVCNQNFKQSLKELEKAKQKLMQVHSQTQNLKDAKNKDLAQIMLQYEGMVAKAEAQHKLNSENLAGTRKRRIVTTEAYKRILQDCGHAKKFQAREEASKEYETNELLSYLFTLHKVTNERNHKLANERKKIGIGGGIGTDEQKDKAAQTKYTMIILREPRSSVVDARIAMEDFHAEKVSSTANVNMNSSNTSSSGNGNTDVSGNGSGESNAETSTKKKATRISKEDAIRSEQLLLLSTHPAGKIPSNTPPADMNGSMEWGEPGWHLNLEVPSAIIRTTRQRRPLNSNCLLQIAPHSSIYNRLSSEFSSSQGHQAASLLDTRHLSSLAYGCSSKSEISGSRDDATLTSVDPLCRDDNAIVYSYTYHPPSKAKAKTSRKRSPKGGTTAKAKKRKTK